MLTITDRDLLVIDPGVLSALPPPQPRSLTT
jgi:hypothetical protein